MSKYILKISGNVESVRAAYCAVRGDTIEACMKCPLLLNEFGGVKCGCRALVDLFPQEALKLMNAYEDFGEDMAPPNFHR